MEVYFLEIWFDLICLFSVNYSDGKYDIFPIFKSFQKLIKLNMRIFQQKETKKNITYRKKSGVKLFRKNIALF